MGSNPTPSSTDCALYAAGMLESLISKCGAPGERPGVHSPALDPALCVLVDVDMFGAIGMLRELLEMASSGRCAEALAAAAEVASYLAGRPELPESVRRWAAEVVSPHPRGGRAPDSGSAQRNDRTGTEDQLHGVTSVRREGTRGQRQHDARAVLLQPSS
ncbi:MAG: hypothetical protein ACP5UK_05960 [Conexivisphaera sp.]